MPARLIHTGPLAATIRDIDRIECTALGRSPKDALRIGLRCSLSAFTALEGRKVLAMFGVVPEAVLGGRGRVWFLGGHDAFRYGRELLTMGPPIIADWLETFTRLENIVAVENAAAIRLLRRWGFEIGDRQEVHGGTAFVPFHKERDSRP